MPYGTRAVEIMRHLLFANNHFTFAFPSPFMRKSRHLLFVDKIAYPQPYSKYLGRVVIVSGLFSWDMSFGLEKN